MKALPEDAIDILSAYVPRRDLVRMRVVTGLPGRWIPWALRTGAVTFDRWVFFRPSRYSTETARGLALIAHEAGHLTQYRELGLLRFLVRYVRGRLATRFDHDRHPMEVPCIELQNRVRDALRGQGWP